jgi:hypothetical protein
LATAFDGVGSLATGGVTLLGTFGVTKENALVDCFGGDCTGRGSELGFICGVGMKLNVGFAAGGAGGFVNEGNGFSAGGFGGCAKRGVAFVGADAAPKG